MSKEEVGRWWSTAKDDLEKAKILFDHEKYDGTVFYCQQAVEKGFKATILQKGDEIKKIHDLVILGRTVQVPLPLLNYCKELTQSYIYARYPDIQQAKNIKEIASKFLRYTKELLAWTEKKLL